jgi:hypothetical protein
VTSKPEAIILSLPGVSEANSIKEAIQAVGRGGYISSEPALIFFRYCAAFHDCFTFRLLIRSCGPWGSRRMRTASTFVPNQLSTG